MSFWTDHPNLKPSTCKSCGKKVLYVEDENGKTQILDPAAPVYIFMNHPNRVQRAKHALVSHFATCPNASQHSKRGKQ